MSAIRYQIYSVRINSIQQQHRRTQVPLTTFCFKLNYSDFVHIRNSNDHQTCQYLLFICLQHIISKSCSTICLSALPHRWPAIAFILSASLICNAKPVFRFRFIKFSPYCCLFRSGPICLLQNVPVGNHWATGMTLSSSSSNSSS